MKTFLEFLAERDVSSEHHGLEKKPFDKNPKIGWWKDQPKHHDGHYIMYHGTHEKNLHHIAKNGIQAPTSGPTAHRVSMTHDPHTAHAYAAMSGSGGESDYRKVGGKPVNTGHDKRAVLVAHIPHDWAHEHMDHHMRGNMKSSLDNLTNKEKYDKHKASGKADHEHYQTTELRFTKPIPPHFIKGYMKKSG